MKIFFFEFFLCVIRLLFLFHLEVFLSFLGSCSVSSSFLRHIFLVLLVKLVGVEVLLLEVLLVLVGSLLALGGGALDNVLEGAADVFLVALSDGLFELLILELEFAAEFLGGVHLACLLHNAFGGAVVDLVGEGLAELLLFLLLLLLVGLLHLLADLVAHAFKVVGNLGAGVLVLDLLVVVVATVAVGVGVVSVLLVLLVVVVVAALLLLGLLVDAVDGLLHLALVLLVGGALAEGLEGLLLLAGGVVLDLRLVLRGDALLEALLLDLLQLVEELALLLT